jgi:polysaccharide pyruvyl transferase WcaK-like protein
MHNILLWSPGIANHQGRLASNLGDQIIEGAILDQLHLIFGHSVVINKVSTHLRFGPAERRLVDRADLVIVGGSNLLSSYMDGYFQWDLTLANALRVRRAILMGCGWWRDQGRANRYTRLLLTSALSWSHLHSVRDSQAYSQLGSINCGPLRLLRSLNTGCPTMWSFLDQHQVTQRSSKGEVALAMLTDYDRDLEADRSMLSFLNANYSTVAFWPQGRDDLDYARDLGFDGVILERSLTALDAFLGSSKSIDYVGTRLHGGIRCLKAGARCLILTIDNRARSISHDTGLPTAARGDHRALERWIEGAPAPNLLLPERAINMWRGQFQHFSPAG